MHVNGISQKQSRITLQIEAYKPMRHWNSAAQSDIQLQSDKSQVENRSLNKPLCRWFDFSTIQKPRFSSCAFLCTKLLLLKKMRLALERQSHSAQGTEHLARQNMIEHAQSLEMCTWLSPRLLSNRNRTKHGKTMPASRQNIYMSRQIIKMYTKMWHWFISTSEQWCSRYSS